MQNNEHSYNTHTINSNNGATNRHHTSWLEFYNRQDMMIMEEIVRAANLYHSAGNNNNVTIQQGSVKVAPSPQTSSEVTNSASIGTSISVSAAGLSSSQTPSLCNVPTQLTPGASYGGAGDTAPVHCNLDPPPGSVLLQNMLLVPIAQTAPMLDTDLRRAQEFYPPLSYVQRQQQGSANIVEVPQLNVWPQDIAPQQHEFFERSRNIIRSLQQNWSPIFGTYVNIPVGELVTVPTMASNEAANDKETHIAHVDVMLPPAKSACAASEANKSEIWEAKPEINEFETVNSVQNIKNNQADLNSNVGKKKQLIFKSVGPEPVEPPSVASEDKPSLSYSDVVRKLALSHPLDGQFNRHRTSPAPIVNDHMRTSQNKAKSTFTLHGESINNRAKSSFFNDERELHCTIYRRRTETSTSRQQITKINLEVTQHRDIDQSPVNFQPQPISHRRKRAGRRHRRASNRNSSKSTLSLASPITNPHMKSLFNDLSMSSSHTSIERSSPQKSVTTPQATTFQKVNFNSVSIKRQEKQRPKRKESGSLSVLPTSLLLPQAKQSTRAYNREESKSHPKAGKHANGRPCHPSRRRQRLPLHKRVSLLQSFNKISVAAFNLLTGLFLVFIHFIIGKFYKSR